MMPHFSNLENAMVTSNQTSPMEHRIFGGVIMAVLVFSTCMIVECSTSGTIYVKATVVSRGNDRIYVMTEHEEEVEVFVSDDIWRSCPVGTSVTLRKDTAGKLGIGKWHSVHFHSVP